MKNLKIMSDIKTFRWAFHIPQWVPRESDILIASSCIQPEEKSRISKFVYKEDFKSSLIGRLMIRKFLQVATGLSQADILLGRDKHGKPILEKPKESDLDFNVSHQGEYVVLAGQIGKTKVGIDVMNNIPPPNKNIPEFFRLMKRQFSASEWANIVNFDTQNEQLAAFYRHWCLKESYVKNIGVGITIDLQKISFNTRTSPLQVGAFVTDTELSVNNEMISDWIFEENLLDKSHGVAVAVNLNGEHYQPPNSYDFLDFDCLVQGLSLFSEADKVFVSNYLCKDEKQV